MTAGAASLPALETAKDDKARRDLGRLAARVDRLEGDNFRLVALIAAGVLLLGLLLPYASFKEGGEQYDASLLASKKGRDFWVADRRHDLPV
ncbi:hypothetical protein ACK8GE_05275 [Micromonosporaceae bacterium DT194]|uniref:hypothetical protein n=1 Tax=Melissospora conviva TaxID=3388432 RepID=UPI003C2A26D5